jgi:hypothetical protein
MGETYQALSEIIRSSIFCFLILAVSIYQFPNFPCPETNHNNQGITNHWYEVSAKQIRHGRSHKKLQLLPKCRSSTARSTIPHWPQIQTPKNRDGVVAVAFRVK